MFRSNWIRAIRQLNGEFLHWCHIRRVPLNHQLRKTRKLDNYLGKFSFEIITSRRARQPKCTLSDAAFSFFGFSALPFSRLIAKIPHHLSCSVPFPRRTEPKAPRHRYSTRKYLISSGVATLKTSERCWARVRQFASIGGLALQLKCCFVSTVEQEHPSLFSIIALRLQREKEQVSTWQPFLATLS